MSNYNTLAIDFDHTIHDNNNPVEGRRMGPPMPGAKEAIESFVAQGYRIVIHTLWGTDDRKQAIEDWLNFYQIPFDEVTNIKPKADAYIDDKAVRYTTWDETRAVLNEVLGKEGL